MNTLSKNTVNNERRFGGIARLYGYDGLKRLRAAHVCVIGVGGVGSWVVESLARSGVGEITMIDMDLVSESNINRQILATTDSVGRDKVVVMQDRIAQINPECKVNCVDEFISRDNLKQNLNLNMDFVIDCIDDFRTKAALISFCKANKINILTIGGAGGQIDPAKIKQSDLSRTEHDVLLARTRKLLRQDYGFARNLKRSFGVPCIYSVEQLAFPDGQGGTTAQRPSKDNSAGDVSDMPNNALNCAGGLGSITHTTGTFAFFASSFVLNKLAREQL
ncbi:UNVERIFIED_CONTAM: hypothetical protein GTU68_028231 [Idotea baltica]|nr:hypothetical protein [Idotea baltica]